MSNFSYDDFAVLVRKFNPEMLSPESLKSLRIVPLSTAPSMADAIKGINLTGLDSDLNLPREKNGTVVLSNVTVQHDSAGYCRLVGHIEAVKSQEGQVTTAKAFVLYRTVTDAQGKTPKKEVLAVASLKEGFAIGDVCYPSFTITTVNNYQSVAFNPNAFATVEDLKNINGLDGLHIAFDTASGDLKLLDKDGNVLDQANLPIKADVIIADGEEGYKYVKTDVKQDIHAAKAWMPEGKTAWEEVLEAPYRMRHAALVVGKGSSRVFVDGNSKAQYPIITDSVQFEHVKISNSIYMVADKTGTGTGTGTGTFCNLLKVKGEAEELVLYEAGISDTNVTYGNTSYPITNEPVDVDVIKDGVTTYVLVEPNSQEFKALSPDGKTLGTGSIETREGTSTGGVVGITLGGNSMYTFEGGAATPSEFKDISGHPVTWFGTKTIPEGYTLKYGLEAFVWTVKGAEVTITDPFFKQLNASLLALGFHEGDDIALGKNLATLAPTEGDSPLNKVDADDYMHGETNKELREQEVDDQRKLAKDELVAWNAQHPGLEHNEVDGTRISSAGVDIRNGKILIGNGSGLGGDADAVMHYELSTNFNQEVDSKDEGLALTVLDASSGNPPRNVLTISDSSYISGAPICMALIEVTESGNGLSFAPKRRTACFECGMSEDAGTVNITITDKRSNSKGFVTKFGVRDDCIVEISPVYISTKSAPEMLPALNMVNTVAAVGSTVEGAGKNDKLTCTCPQIIDWANSVNLQSQPENRDARLFVIVKVY